MPRIPMAQFGMGPIGLESVRLASQLNWCTMVGAVDVDPVKIGRSLADLTGIPSLSEARVHGSFDDLWLSARPSVVLHTAGSRAAQALEQIAPMVDKGVSIASTCEELLFPNLRAADEARRINALAQRTGARIVGTGVNPGFVMDVLPVCLTGVCRDVTQITARRTVNASTRRKPLQMKIGSGMEPAAFRQAFTSGRMGHAGFQESAALIAHCMNWDLDEIVETCDPVVADRPIRTDFVEVAAGRTCGLHQRCVGKIDGQPKIALELKMYLDAPDSHDAVQISGDPPIDLIVRGGIAGDHATVAALLNAVPRLLSAAPGLRLMTELAVPAWTGGACAMREPAEA